jgi:hypothetical protein
MSEYIDRQALLDAIPSTKEDKQISLFGAVADFISLVCDVPAADVAPVVHAHWKGYHTQEPYCSNCGFTYDHEQGEDAQTTDYCGNCGAKMDENEVENLKRCSCGDRHYCPEVEKDENGKWFIRCYRCRKIVWGNTMEEAANAWNGSQNYGAKMDGGDT